MMRRIGLSLGLLVSIVVMLPFATSTAHNLRTQLAAHSHRHHHSRAWWRRHRARIRRRAAMLTRRRTLEANSRTGSVILQSEKSSDNHATMPALAFPQGVYRDGTFSMSLPDGWSAGLNTKGASSFRIAPPNGTPEAQATLAVVAVAPANVDQIIGREQHRMLGGVPFTDLRRSVIDKMIGNGGWVVNDRQREIGGHRVFEVVAQTPATSDGKPEQLWNFYFTEINGRVYSLTTRTSGGQTQKIAGDAEKFLSDFQPNGVSRN